MEQENRRKKKKICVSMWQETLLWHLLPVGISLRHPLCIVRVWEKDKGVWEKSCHGLIHRIAGQEGKQIAEESDLIKSERK